MRRALQSAFLTGWGTPMGREIRYCDRCAQLVSPGDIASGKATVTDDFVLCVSCTKLQTAERASTPEPSAPVAAASPTAVRPRSRCVPERPAGGSQAKTFTIAAVVAALVTVPVAVLVMRGRGDADAPRAACRPSRAGRGRRRRTPRRGPGEYDSESRPGNHDKRRRQLHDTCGCWQPPRDGRQSRGSGSPAWRIRAL
ncbi:MAG: hypothetical protein ACYTFI_15455 [Planctomycetota bacterium]|jgi:hypothetical protein